MCANMCQQIKSLLSVLSVLNHPQSSGYKNNLKYKLQYLAGMVHVAQLLFCERCIKWTQALLGDNRKPN